MTPRPQDAPAPFPIANQALLKRLNRAAVLKLLRRHGGLSRARLAGLTRLDGKTITNVSKDLLKLGMIKPVGKIRRGVGRPSEILELNPAYGWALGLDLGARHAAGVAVDFSGAIVARARAEIRFGMKPPVIMKRLCALGKKIIRQLGPHAKRPPRSPRLLGLGLGVPGVVDRSSGVGVMATNLAGWRNVPLRAPLAQAFRTEVFVEEATRAAALGEIFGRVREELRDFLLLDLSEGIGAALVQNGRLYYGHSGLAGEIGHTTIRPGGRPCRCGKRGCLEAESSGHAIAKQATEMRMSGAGFASVSRNKNKKKHTLRNVSAEQVAQAAQAGDPACARLFTEAARTLGVAAANAVMLLNPGAVILTGGLTRAGELLLRPFREALRQGVAPEMNDGLRVEVSPLGGDGGPLGAASLVLSRVLQAPGEESRMPR